MGKGRKRKTPSVVRKTCFAERRLYGSLDFAGASDASILRLNKFVGYWLTDQEEARERQERSGITEGSASATLKCFHLASFMNLVPPLCNFSPKADDLLWHFWAGVLASHRLVFYQNSNPIFTSSYIRNLDTMFSGKTTTSKHDLPLMEVFSELTLNPHEPLAEILTSWGILAASPQEFYTDSGNNTPLYAQPVSASERVVLADDFWDGGIDSSMVVVLLSYSDLRVVMTAVWRSLLSVLNQSDTDPRLGALKRAMVAYEQAHRRFDAWTMMFEDTSNTSSNETARARDIEALLGDVDESENYILLNRLIRCFERAEQSAQQLPAKEQTMFLTLQKWATERLVSLTHTPRAGVLSL